MFHKFPYKTISLNVRDFPESVLRKAKSKAALQGISLRYLTVCLFELYISGVADDILEIDKRATPSDSPSPSPEAEEE